MYFIYIRLYKNGNTIFIEAMDQLYHVTLLIAISQVIQKLTTKIDFMYALFLKGIRRF